MARKIVTPQQRALEAQLVDMCRKLTNRERIAVWLFAEGLALARIEKRRARSQAGPDAVLAEPSA